MLFDATLAGRTERVEVRETQGLYRVRVGERQFEFDARTLSSVELSALVDTQSHDVVVEKTTDGFAVILRGDRFDVELKDAVQGAALGRAAHSGPTKLTAPMPGKIVKVLVAEGEAVDGGRGVLVMEAMKMENELKAPRAGTVQEIRVREGQAVEMGALLLILG